MDILSTKTEQQVENLSDAVLVRRMRRLVNAKKFVSVSVTLDQWSDLCQIGTYSTVDPINARGYIVLSTKEIKGRQVFAAFMGDETIKLFA